MDYDFLALIIMAVLVIGGGLWLLISLSDEAKRWRDRFK
jgi:hypothetical protein